MCALKIWLGIIWHGRLIKPLGIIWGLIGVDLINSQFFENHLANISNFLPAWGWQYWVIIALLLLLVITIEGIYRKESSKAVGNWISAHQFHTGKLPSIPDYLLPVVQKYTRGNQITKEIELITMSGQFWNNLLPSQRDELKQLVEWVGMSWDDYLEQMRRMLPKDPQLGSKHKPFEQH